MLYQAQIFLVNETPGEDYVKYFKSVAATLNILFDVWHDKNMNTLNWHLSTDMYQPVASLAKCNLVY